MNTCGKPWFKLIFAILPLVYFISSCNDIKMNSQWCNREIFIDGMSFDWENILMNFEYKKINLGILNDDAYLYICLVPLDEVIIQQVMMMGFTVWLTAESDKDFKLGICYPVGIGNNRRLLKDIPIEQNREELKRIFEESLNEIMIISSNKGDTITIPVENISSVEVRVGTKNERMVYELKIPLIKSSDYPYAIGAFAGQQIEIEFLTGELKKPMMNKSLRNEVSRPDRDSGGKGMRPGGGRRQGNNMEHHDMQQPLKMKIKVKLADKINADN
ncbi:MAG: hypothetical protein J7K40_12390 [candidate division Zixibacteria bacterium]|nr:hypothetical protein [candidate division Zixibacteria bacterium]